MLATDLYDPMAVLDFTAAYCQSWIEEIHDDRGNQLVVQVITHLYYFEEIFWYWPGAIN